MLSLIKKLNTLGAIVLILSVAWISCENKTDEEILFDQILGTWNSNSKESGMQQHGSTKTYYSDSTFFWFYGDYFEEGKFLIEDSILKVTNLYGGNPRSYKIIELNESLYKSANAEQTDTFTFYRQR